MKSLDIEALWRCLPTFRVVAEHESVGEAARLLCLSASSVSRTVRLLEKDLGQPLFCRGSGRFSLNDVGRDFLEAVRRSMRLVDDAAEEVRREPGPVRLSCPRFIVPFIAPALAHFRRERPSTVLRLCDEVGTRELAAGIVDIVIVTQNLDVDGVEAHAIASMPTAAYVSPLHPLAAEGAPSFIAALRHGWVTAPREVLDRNHWPIDQRRLVSTHAIDLTHVRDACVAGLGPALLPTFLAHAAVTGGDLVRIVGRSFPDVPVYALRRPRLVADAAETMLACLAARGEACRRST